MHATREPHEPMRPPMPHVEMPVYVVVLRKCMTQFMTSSFASFAACLLCFGWSPPLSRYFQNHPWEGSGREKGRRTYCCPITWSDLNLIVSRPERNGSTRRFHFVPNNQQATIATPALHDPGRLIRCALCFESKPCAPEFPVSLNLFPVCWISPNQLNGLSEACSASVMPDAIHQCLYTPVLLGRTHNTLKRIFVSCEKKNFLSLTCERSSFAFFYSPFKSTIYTMRHTFPSIAREDVAPG